MKEVWKYPVPFPKPEFTIYMPAGAEALTMKVQEGDPYDPESFDIIVMWALVDPEAVPIGYDFILVGTGNPIPDEIDWTQHIDSVITGDFVWHLFEKRATYEFERRETNELG